MASASGPAAIQSTAASAAQVEQVRQLHRYTVASFRNAGMPQSEWSDGAQQVVLELLQKDRRRQSGSSGRPSADPQGELNRAIWRIVKRWKRRRSPQSMGDPAGVGEPVGDDRRRRSGWTLEELQQLPGARLSDRQKRILALLREGGSVQQVARRLGLDAAQVSHEKYRAIHKLRRAWQEYQQQAEV